MPIRNDNPFRERFSGTACFHVRIQREPVYAVNQAQLLHVCGSHSLSATLVPRTGMAYSKLLELPTVRPMYCVMMSARVCMYAYTLHECIMNILVYSYNE